MSRRIVRLTMSQGLIGVSLVVMLAVVSLVARSADTRAGALTAPDKSALAAAPFTITLEPVVGSGLSNPVYLTHAGDGSGRLFVVDKPGRIRIIKNGTLLTMPYLDISSSVRSSGSEQGLLSVAFDPDYKSNGVFYVDYTDKSGIGNTVVARYVVSDPSSDVANPVTVTTLLHIVQPETNHNGGQLQFGPNDGYLYVGMGDGGGGGDNHGTIGNGQDLTTLLGKLLRINVRGVPTYTIPASNPFTQTVGARPEIWAFGLRNPWRFSFDRANGDLYIADVGQDSYEEVDYQPASSTGGENYGWRIMEGLHCFNPSSGCNTSGLTLPVAEYNHSFGCSITGGYVYRGSAYPWMDGTYFFADYCAGTIWSLTRNTLGAWQMANRLESGLAVSSFGEDESGELYVVNLGGGIYKITSSTPFDLSTTTKQASLSAPLTGDVLTFTIALRNSGGPFSDTVRLTDTIPAGLGYMPGSFTATRGIPDASAVPMLIWTGSLSNTYAITLTYAVTVSAVSTLTINNLVTVNPGITTPFTRSATIIANGFPAYLPLMAKN